MSSQQTQEVSGWLVRLQSNVLFLANFKEILKALQICDYLAELNKSKLLFPTENIFYNKHKLWKNPTSGFFFQREPRNVRLQAKRNLMKAFNFSGIFRCFLTDLQSKFSLFFNQISVKDASSAGFCWDGILQHMTGNPPKKLIFWAPHVREFLLKLQ